MKEDSYLKDIGLKNLDFKDVAIAYFKIVIIFPLALTWKIFKFLFNPKKSSVKIFKKAIIFPLLEFFTGKSTSDQILGDYTYFHQSVLKQEIFENENLKLNFVAHKEILLNSRIATFASMLMLIMLYSLFFESLNYFQVVFLGLSLFTAGLSSIFAFLIIFVKFFLVIALFAVEISLINSLFVTDRNEIKDYLDEVIFYANMKNEEIFGEEHAQKVKNVLYDSYLTKKEKIQNIEINLLDEYLTSKLEQLSIKKIENEEKTDENINFK